MTPNMLQNARRTRPAIALLAALLLASCGGDSAAERVSGADSADADLGLRSTGGSRTDDGATSPKRTKTAPVAEEPAPAPAPSATLAFTLSPPDESPVPASEIDIAGTAKVFIVSDWKAVTADLGQRLDIFDPSGGLYYSTVIPFTGSQRSDVSVTLLADGTYRVRYTLEIWGTPIEAYWMAGGWRAAVSLGGTAPTAASANVVFR